MAQCLSGPCSSSPDRALEGKGSRSRRAAAAPATATMTAVSPAAPRGRARPRAPPGGAAVPARRRPRAGRGGASCRRSDERDEAAGSAAGRWIPCGGPFSRRASSVGGGGAGGRLTAPRSRGRGRHRLGSGRLPSRAPREKARRSHRGRRALAPRSVAEAARSGSAERSAELRACGWRRARRTSYKAYGKSQRRAARLCVRSQWALRLGVGARPARGARCQSAHRPPARHRGAPDRSGLLTGVFVPSASWPFPGLGDPRSWPKQRLLPSHG